MTRVVKRAFRYRFYPTCEQAEQLNRTFGCVRLVYNKALDARSRAYATARRTITYGQTSALLTEWRHDPELAFLNEVSAVPLQQALRHLQAAFTAFFTNRARYPRFKSRKRSRASAEYTRSAFRWRNGHLWLAKMTEPLNIVWSRPLPAGAEPSTVTVSHDAVGRWHVSLLVETTVEDLPATDAAVGVDAGLTALVTLSTGEKIPNPRHEQTDRRKLATAQRALCRKEKGSANRAKAKLKVARIHARIADRRTMLEYKAAWYGRTLVVVDRWLPSSKQCSTCGRRAEAMPLAVRGWICPCGATHDRDVNAARNILAAGLVER